MALVRANVRFWPSVFPDVRSELRRWSRCARAIPDASLREQALAKLRCERFNTEVAATLATLVQPVRRHAAVEAIVALQVMYDYLDGLTEQPVARPLAGGRQLYRVFADATAPVGPFADHYRRYPAGDDGGYLTALATTCRRALWSLPAAPVVAPELTAVLARCGEAQTRTHAVGRLGTRQLRAWALADCDVGELRWWEAAAGAAASVLAAHALLALAADPAATAADAARVAAAYRTTCALTTLLDSLIDADADALDGGHAYLAYYADDDEAAERLALLAREALAAAAQLPHASHQLMTVAGAVAFYLSAPAAATPRARRLTAPMTRELRPLLDPALVVFAAWRGVKRRRESCTQDGASPTRDDRPARAAGPPQRPRGRRHAPPARAALAPGARANARHVRAQARSVRNVRAKAHGAHVRAMSRQRRVHAHRRRRARSAAR